MSIKEAFVSRFHQGYLLEADYSQLEIYTLAVITEDKQLKEDLLSGIDLHCMSCSMLTGLPYSTVLANYEAGESNTIAARKLAKTLSFQLQYGAGPSKMAEANGISFKEARRFYDSYYERYWGVKLWQGRTIHEVNGNSVPSGYFTPNNFPARISKWRSSTGRIFTFIQTDGFGGDPSFKPTEIKNYPIQGFAWDIVSIALGDIFDAIKKEKTSEDILLINTIHDSIILDVKAEAVHTAAKIVKAKMEDVPNRLKQIYDVAFDLPLKVSISLGYNWNSMEPYDDTRNY